MWITLHANTYGGTIFVNTDHICAICSVPPSGSTCVQFTGTGGNFIEVKESPEEVVRKITG